VNANTVITDQVHVLDADVLGHGLRIEQPLAGRLGLAVRTRAADAQVARCPHVLDATLVPYDAYFSLAESDDLERHGHGPRIAPFFAAVAGTRSRFRR